ncbi:MAG: 30S ribosomal protein S8 [Patescibacteria group bacterium]
MQTSNDTISDFLARVNNAILARHENLIVPKTKSVLAIARILEKRGYFKSVEVISKAPQDDLKITLKYFKGESVIRGLNRVSKPGRRIYARMKKIPKTIEGLGLTIISTSKGILTRKEAFEQKVGGEVLCQIW